MTPVAGVPVDELDRLIDDRLRFAGPDGRVVGKADDLEAHRTGVVRFEALDILSRELVVESEVAVALVFAHVRATVGGESFDSRVLYTRCWVQGADGWRILGGSVLPVGLSPREMVEHDFELGTNFGTNLSETDETSDDLKLHKQAR